jgi:phage shock protein A
MFKRIINLLKGFLTLFISGMEKRNLDALIELEREDLHKQAMRYKAGLVSLDNLSKFLSNQIKKLEAEEWDLRAKVLVNLKTNFRELAAQHALRLQLVNQRLAESRSQQEQVETTRKTLMTAHDQLLELSGKTHHQADLTYAGEAEQAALAEMALTQFILQERLEMPKALEDKSGEATAHSEEKTEKTVDGTVVSKNDLDSPQSV